MNGNRVSRLLSRSNRIFTALGSTILLCLASLIASPDPAHAADELILTYGVLQASIDVADLERLAQTGEVARGLNFYLNFVNLDPEVLRLILTTEFTVDPMLLDSLFNSEGGEYLLSEMTQVIHTPSQQANIQALRSAIVLTSQSHQTVTLLGILQNYPTQQVYINGVNLLRLARELGVERLTREVRDE
ncbi:alpha/beta hydrolase [Egbenema bharatensis]|uniref:alpha/beta hydrolase n=1 Tax=Egbenema bharatensis TaxID=3463334 RepID=UPI003A85C748